MNKENLEQTKMKAEIRKPKKWSEPIQSSTFFEFKNIGDTIEGLLLSKDKEFSELFTFYKIKQWDGIDKKFHGSKQLDDLLENLQLPLYVQITYISDLSVKNGTLKQFEVRTGEN